MVARRRSGHVDNLRGLCIISVIALHGWDFSFLVVPYLRHAYSRFISNGYYGVSIFFVISGFLISRNIIYRSGDLEEVNLRSFYVMRAARILPLLFIFSLLSLTLSYANDAFIPADQSLLSLAALSAFLFKFNYFYLLHGGAGRVSSWAPLWSLAVEEQFYVCYPLLLKSIRRERLVAALILVAFTGPLRRVSLPEIYTLSGCVDSLAFGCLAAIFERSSLYKSIGIYWSYAARILGLSLVLGVFSCISIIQFYNWSPTLISLGSAVFLAFAFSNQSNLSERSILRVILTPLGFCGRLSYEIYIFHLTFLIAASVFLAPLISPNDAFAYWFIAFGTLVAFCWILSKMYTEPLNGWIRMKLLYSSVDTTKKQASSCRHHWPVNSVARYVCVAIGIIAYWQSESLAKLLPAKLRFVSGRTLDISD